MLYPLCIIYFAIKIYKSNDKKSLTFNILALGLLVGIGTKIKYSVIIAFIAVVVVFALNLKFKKIIAMTLSILVGYTMVSAVIDGFMYKNILDEEKAYDMSTPFIAWIAMGLEGDGTHNANDNHFIWEQTTHEDKVNGAVFLLTARLEDKGAMGYLSFLNKKMVRSFGSGNLDYINTVADSPMHQNIMVDILNKDGKYNSIYDNIIQGYHILVLLSMIYGAYVTFKRKDERFLSVQISSLGMLMFLLLWEAGTRYLLNYYPIFILSGIIIVFSNEFEYNYKNKSKSEIVMSK